MSNKVDVINKKFGSLLVVDEAPSHRRPNGRMVTIIVAICECGSRKKYRKYHLLSGHTLHCGCKSVGRVSHGETINNIQTAEYVAWAGMIQRCKNTKRHNYHRYGGRGIDVCPRWKSGEGGKSGYKCFLSDMGRKPSKEFSLDRYPNPDGNYEPSNCRWATITQQNNNLSSHKKKGLMR